MVDRTAAQQITVFTKRSRQVLSKSRQSVLFCAEFRTAVYPQGITKTGD